MNQGFRDKMRAPSGVREWAFPSELASVLMKYSRHLALAAWERFIGRATHDSSGR